MYFIIGILGAISLYSYYDNVKKITIDILLSQYKLKEEKIEECNTDVEVISIIKRKYDNEEFEVVPAVNSYELTEIIHNIGDKEYSYLSSGTDTVYWPPKEKNDKKYLTIYCGDKNIGHLFERYAGPDKNFYDGNIYLKFILKNSDEILEQDTITIMDNLGNFHKILAKEICYKFI
tara:strand:- start:188 stop:715 length:528 start_codon:yes stop_codon:yes gene_type:complete